MTNDQDWKEKMDYLFRLHAEIAEQMKDTDRRMKENAEQQKENERIMKERQQETDRQQQATDRQLKQLGKQMGQLGNKFGSFTEGLAWPSLEKLLYERFGMNDISRRKKAKLNGRSLELDVLAYDNTGVRNELFIVEVKSHLTQEGIDQILQTIADFPHFFTDLKERKIYGIIVAVDIPDNLRAAVIKRGLYLAQISDESFKLLVPRNFQPIAFGNGANGQAKKKAPRPSK